MRHDSGRVANTWDLTVCLFCSVPLTILLVHLRSTGANDLDTYSEVVVVAASRIESIGGGGVFEGGEGTQCQVNSFLLAQITPVEPSPSSEDDMRLGQSLLDYNTAITHRLWFTTTTIKYGS